MTQTNTSIRPPEPGDQVALRRLVEALDLFPPDILPQLMQDADAVWRIAVSDAQCLGLAYATPEMLTDQTWNLRAIGTHPNHARQGLGRDLMTEVEAALRSLSGRLLIVDTSSTPDFDAARAFYTALGYDTEARIRDFWAEGDDKVTFRKVL